MSRKGWDKCALCGTTENIEYCSMCKHYFCTECKKKYPARVKAMMEEKTHDLGSWLARSLGIK